MEEIYVYSLNVNHPTLNLIYQVLDHKLEENNRLKRRMELIASGIYPNGTREKVNDFITTPGKDIFVTDDNTKTIELILEEAELV